MADKSLIEWTDATWNPVVGCRVLSPGCTNCYAMAMAARIERMNPASHYARLTQPSKAGPVWTGGVAMAPDNILTQPLRWRGRRIFVNSMGDLFHESVPDAWIDQVFAVMALAPQHTFQVLTKRAARMREYISRIDCAQRVADTFSLQDVARRNFAWPLPNVWLGVSVEDQTRAEQRVWHLLRTPAAIRFVSAEPLLGAIDFTALEVDGDSELDALNTPPTLNEEWAAWRDATDEAADESLEGFNEWFGAPPSDDRLHPTLDWVIAGGESGPSARPMHPDWARSLRDQCADAGVPFHFKQWGEWAPEGLCGQKWIIRADGTSDPVPTPNGIGHHAPREGSAFIYRVGKRAAGRLLDGVEHNGSPETSL
jgi:protein gp37